MPYDIIVGRNEKDKEKFGKEGTIFLGKQYVKMGQTTSLSNEIFMDVSRAHIVFICGKRGSGKCLTGDTLITLDNGLEVPIEKLENIDNNVLGLNKRLKIDSLRKDKFFKRYVNEILYVKLRSGKEIKLTPEHPLLTVKGWTSVKNLTIGSRIATPRIMPSFGKDSMEEHEIKLLAYLIAEGHIKKPMLFSNMDQCMVNEVNSCLKELHGGLELIELQKGCYKINARNIKRHVLSYGAYRDSEGRFTKGSNITHEKTPIRLFLERHGMYGLSSKEKFIPEDIFKLKKEQIALFLNRLFSCDGSIYKPQKNSNYWEVFYSSISKRMAMQVHSLLLRFGILSRLRSKKVKFEDKLFDSFEVVLDGINVIKFVNQIGFFSIKEKKQVSAKKDMENLNRNPNVDTIPKDIWDFYRPKNWALAGKRCGYKHPKALRSSINYSASRQKLLQIAIADENEPMRLLAEADIFWDEIVEIKKLEGRFAVYDISVPKNHNFVANNIIVHNSYTMGVIAEGMSDLPLDIKENVAVVMLDTMGIYWTMKYANKKEAHLLDEWGLKGKPLDIHIYTPVGYYKKFKEQGIPTDFPFSIKPSELNPHDWCLTFDIPVNSQHGVLIERLIQDLSKAKPNFSVDDIIDKINSPLMRDRSEQHVRDFVENRFLAAKNWGLFGKEGTPISDLVSGGQVTVIDVSCYVTTPGAEGLRALVIGLISQKLFVHRMVSRKMEEFAAIKKSVHYVLEEEKEQKQKYPLVWLVIDEAHEFLPNEGKTAASNALVTILREGRQPGISLILATQQPGKIHTDVMTQSDIVISHRLTAKVDVEALGMLMQSYMREGLDKQLNYLPSLNGSAVVFDDVNERLYPMRVRPRFTWHGGESPTAIKEKKKVFEF